MSPGSSEYSELSNGKPSLGEKGTLLKEPGDGQASVMCR